MNIVFETFGLDDKEKLASAFKKLRDGLSELLTGCDDRFSHMHTLYSLVYQLSSSTENFRNQEINTKLISSNEEINRFPDISGKLIGIRDYSFSSLKLLRPIDRVLMDIKMIKNIFAYAVRSGKIPAFLNDNDIIIEKNKRFENYEKYKLIVLLSNSGVLLNDIAQCIISKFIDIY